jgi:hypothetical protein
VPKAKAQPGAGVYDALAAQHARERELAERWDDLAGSSYFVAEHDTITARYAAGEPVEVSAWEVAHVLYGLGRKPEARAINGGVSTPARFTVNPDGSYQ